jgi:hypothetical protein
MPDNSNDPRRPFTEIADSVCAEAKLRKTIEDMFKKTRRDPAHAVVQPFPCTTKLLQQASYQVLDSFDLVALVKQVNAELAKGWTVAGGISVIMDNSLGYHQLRYYQAMQQTPAYVMGVDPAQPGADQPVLQTMDLHEALQPDPVKVVEVMPDGSAKVKWE